MLTTDWSELTVLGIEPNKGLIAHKIRDDSMTFDSFDCAYPDISEGESVTLGLWSIKKDKNIMKWEVYPKDFQQEHCIPMSEAKNAWRTPKKNSNVSK